MSDHQPFTLKCRYLRNRQRASSSRVRRSAVYHQLQRGTGADHVIRHVPAIERWWQSLREGDAVLPIIIFR